jgi:hypothetical protein
LVYNPNELKEPNPYEVGAILRVAAVSEQDNWQESNPRFNGFGSALAAGLLVGYWNKYM